MTLMLSAIAYDIICILHGNDALPQKLARVSVVPLLPEFICISSCLFMCKGVRILLPYISIKQIFQMNRTWNIVDVFPKPRQRFQASLHDETSTSKSIHASTLHVTCLSFSFCRMVLLSKHFRKLGLQSLYTLCRLCMKHY